ncbi:TonB-dependent receptor [Asticcacaulis endophyticus]|uniref:TonB-dependent receptor n=1 Tax=Asticcacaulis endophyticus TaxID=1395890 RepID=A0A918QEZ9_9CAUL|nr:TonB-dependent receptor [Asticcacaulis endophyticus]
MRVTNRNKLMASTIFGGSLLMSTLMATVSYAQDAVPPAEDEVVQEVVVTGSRIRRSSTKTSAPLTMIDAQTLTDRGVVQAGEMLNLTTSISASFPLADGTGNDAGTGQQFPNLFGMGAGRTLTLVNGRRFIASQSGMDGNAVDTNIIPSGLIKRIDVVQAGGAAVYGSDAIAGVINYVLKDDFEGAELDIQTGTSSRGDYNKNAIRATFGHNFDNGKGNLAFDAGWSSTDPLYWNDRPRSALGRVNVSSGNTNPSDGIPTVRENLDTRFWSFNTNGVIFATAPAPALNPDGTPRFILKSNGTYTQFNDAGTGLAAYDSGTPGGIPFSSGGDGFSYRELAALYTGVERSTATLIGHYDLTDRVKLYGEVTYAEVEGYDPYQSYQSNTVLNAPATGSGYIAFTRNNAFLTPDTITALTTASPSFGAGAPLFMSKIWADLWPSRAGEYITESYRALGGISGDFDAFDRNFYWDVSYSRGVTEGKSRGWGTITANLAKAVNAVKNSSGQIVCAVNADVSTTNDDVACVPINMFGTGNVTEAGRAYVSAEVGSDYKNTQDDFLATIGGDLINLPAGMVNFSLAYEHRKEEAEFNPLPANLNGTVGAGTKTLATQGEYKTDEYSAEVLIPIVGGDFTLPFVQALEVSGAYRYVDHSIAGNEDVWGAGIRWQVVDSFAFRANQSRNFRAPTLTQLFAPTSTALGSVGQDPCDFRYINSGPAPATRLANCQAEWTAAGRNPAALTTFQNDSTNFSSAMVTTGGNADLKNEVSETTTYGFVFQPTFLSGLTVVVDRFKVELENGLSAFAPVNFMSTCYDSSVRPVDVCSTFTRDATTGNVVTAVTTTYNAGQVNMEGEIYNVNYTFPLGKYFGDRDLGRLELGMEATHLALYETSVTGFDLTRTDGTTLQPEWTTRVDVNWSKGPYRASYSAFYLSEGKVNRTDTIENTPTPNIDANLRHSISAQYDVNEKLTVRGGVTNLTDEEPSYPTLNYGDILGRQYYVGLKAKF